jgi:hypothetical protein
MPGKRSGGPNKLINAIVGAIAAFAARKLLSFAWKKITGKEPPEHPEDPQVALREALVWGLVVGAGVHTARLLATRFASRAGSESIEGPPEEPPA